MCARLRGWRLIIVAAILAAVPLVAGTAPASTAPDIGRVKAVVLAACGTPPAEGRQTLYTRDRVFTDEVLETPRKSSLHITFLDTSIFRLGSSSLSMTHRDVRFL